MSWSSASAFIDSGDDEHSATAGHWQSWHGSNWREAMKADQDDGRREAREKEREIRSLESKSARTKDKKKIGQYADQIAQLEQERRRAVARSY